MSAGQIHALVKQNVKQLITTSTYVSHTVCQIQNKTDEFSVIYHIFVKNWFLLQSITRLLTYRFLHYLKM